MLGFEPSKKLANDEKMASQFSNNFEAIAAIHCHKSRVYPGKTHSGDWTLFSHNKKSLHIMSACHFWTPNEF